MNYKGVFGSKEWEGRRGIFIEGRGGEGKLLITYVFGSKEGMGGEVRDFNYRYVWFTRGGEVF
jgi:hypothetical protein